MSYISDKELKELNKDNLIFDKKNESIKNKLAFDLENGLGCEIINAIREPIKISKFRFFMFKLKKLINKIFNSL